MVGGSRNVRSLYRRTRPQAEDDTEGLGSQTRRTGTGGTRRTRTLASLGVQLPRPEEAQGEQEEAQEEEEEAQEEEAQGEQEEAQGEQEEATIWQRGPSQLPKRPIMMHRRPLIWPVGTSYVHNLYFDIFYVQIHNMN